MHLTILMSILVHTLQVHLIAPEKLRGEMDKRKLHSFTWIWSSFRVDPLVLPRGRVSGSHFSFLPPCAQVLPTVKGQVGSETALRTKPSWSDIIKAQ